MTFKEKITYATDVELEFYLNVYRHFNCDGIKCDGCIFSDEKGFCCFVSVSREYNRRKNIAE